MILQFNADGTVTGIVGSFKEETAIDPSSLGKTSVKRQGVLTQIDGQWFADMFLVDSSVVLGPFKSRSEAIAGEVAWLLQNRF
jgi:hypothetical protein